jgi:hypothetical protein
MGKSPRDSHHAYLNNQTKTPAFWTGALLFNREDYFLAVFFSA